MWCSARVSCDFSRSSVPSLVRAPPRAVMAAKRLPRRSRVLLPLPLPITSIPFAFVPMMHTLSSTGAVVSCSPPPLCLRRLNWLFDRYIIIFHVPSNTVLWDPSAFHSTLSPLLLIVFIFTAYTIYITYFNSPFLCRSWNRRTPRFNPPTSMFS